MLTNNCMIFSSFANSGWCDVKSNLNALISCSLLKKSSLRFSFIYELLIPLLLDIKDFIVEAKVIVTDFCMRGTEARIPEAKKTIENWLKSLGY